MFPGQVNFNFENPAKNFLLKVRQKTYEIKKNCFFPKCSAGDSECAFLPFELFCSNSQIFLLDVSKSSIMSFIEILFSQNAPLETWNALPKSFADNFSPHVRKVFAQSTRKFVRFYFSFKLFFKKFMKNTILSFDFAEY